jgi:hypothetical protein
MLLLKQTLYFAILSYRRLSTFHAEFNADVTMRTFAKMIGVDPNAWGEEEK